MVELLVASGVPVDTKADDDATPLLYVVLAKRLEVVRALALLAFGVDPLQEFTGGYGLTSTIIDRAITSSNPNIIAALRAKVEQFIRNALCAKRVNQRTKTIVCTLPN